MRANRKFINAEEAVSPVIAVILMVAITVVLAATVFVLVNDLGKNVGQTGPSLGLVSDSAQSSTAKWTVKVSSATKLASLSDYRFVVTSPSNGTMVVVPTTSTFSGGYDQFISRPNGNTARTEGGATNETAPAAATFVGYKVLFLDVDGNGKYSVGDTLTITYDTNLADENAEAGADGLNNFDNTFAPGEYTLEILHTPTGSSTASLPRTF